MEFLIWKIVKVIKYFLLYLDINLDQVCMIKIFLGFLDSKDRGYSVYCELLVKF